ncbi:MAG: acyl-CoA dehydrogenase C-terminal domain-containing protein [Proteobacteria bacterium]|nr:acyl-CoA dehydrogenase C-terminal domain-containing protein [Pseudomonadota bacterium]
MTSSARDTRFLLFDVFDFPGHYAQLDIVDPPGEPLISAILDEAQRFADNELAPINSIGDQQGCRLEDGKVTTPDGFKAAYKLFCANAWPSLTGDTRYGGQGLPDSMSLVLEQTLCTANLAWAMYPGLSRGVIEALESHGSDVDKQNFLPRLISGEWTGTMCLTEPHAGSDVGLAKTRARPNADGTYAISGTKIFISAGEHDLADNIVHLVLARFDDAPAGTRGISMFVVPKIDLDGRPNNVVCGSIEEKMGIHGNATCELLFDVARGYLIGEMNQGMRYMFTMMNAARVVVGFQAICLAQAAFDKAARYAVDRLQMRSLSGPKAPDQPADPILVHPDVRRMLLTQKAVIEGGRALVYFTGALIDKTERGRDETQRAEAGVLLDFLTPIVKGFLTEVGFDAINDAVQIFGGHGFIAETGVEQMVRDARITLLYEGTTQIQALDLLGRKVLMKQGAGLIAFGRLMEELAGECDGKLDDLAAGLRGLIKEWSDMTFALAAVVAQNPDELGAASVDYLFYSGYATLAYCWARMAVVAAADGEDPFMAGKLATARFYFKRVLPRAGAHKQALEAGADVLMDISDEALTNGASQTGH